MPRRPDLPCADCGTLMWRTRTSRPEGQARCQPCRRANPVHGTLGAYRKHGCRCVACRSGHNEAQKAYVALVTKRDGISPDERYRPRKRRPCTVCGTVMKAGGTSPTPRCQPCLLMNRRTKRRAASRRRAAVQKLRVAAAGQPANPNWPWVVGACANCGESFTRKGMASSYCSVRCKRADRPKGAFISRSERRRIYERDNWTCQLCMDPVDPALHYLDDWAASLDHIEPQSRALFPDHSPKNLRLAHRWCNSVRGDESYYTEADLRGAHVA